MSKRLIQIFYQRASKWAYSKLVGLRCPGLRRKASAYIASNDNAVQLTRNNRLPHRGRGLKKNLGLIQAK